MDRVDPARPENGSQAVGLTILKKSRTCGNKPS